MVIVRRFAENPLLRPEDIVPSAPDLEVLGAFNPGAFAWDDEVCLLVRIAERPRPTDPDTVVAPYFDPAKPVGRMSGWTFARGDARCDFSDTRLVRTPEKTYILSGSHLRLARSADGVRFAVSPAPTLWPAGEYENLGIEDPRVVRCEGRWLITYSAISRDHGVCSSLVTTTDWRRFEHRGVLFVPDNKDIALFPERVGRRYLAFHRPSVSMLGQPNLWLAESPDLVHWGRHECLLKVRPGRWDSERIGCGPPPIRTDEGWLEFYHGSDGHSYSMGAVLLDLDDPYRVLARSREPLFGPEAPYEKEGFFANVVFSNGLVERPGGKVWLYYGAADACTAACELDVAEVLGSLRR